MIKISVSFNKKIPGEEQYSSLCFHTAMERELSDGLSGEKIQAEIHRSYQLLEKTVETEIFNYKSKTLQVSSKETSKPQNQTRPPVPKSTQSSPSGNITQKQISLICTLAQQSDLSQHQLNDETLRHYGMSSYYDLTKAQASAFIKMLQARKQPA